MFKSLGFASGLGLHVHIRTTRVDNPAISFSYISDVAVKLGDDVFEVMANGSIIVNGEEVDRNHDITFAGHLLTKSTKGVHDNIHVYILNLGGTEDSGTIEIRANEKSKILFVDVKGVISDSAGLLGTGTTSADSSLLARDKVTDLTGYWNTYGEEWQVRDTEMKLFRENRPPQFPVGCRYDESEDTINKKQKQMRLRQRKGRRNHRNRRRLMEEDENENKVTLGMAREACSKAYGRQKEFCVADVLATGHVEVAEDPFYY